MATRGPTHVAATLLSLVGGLLGMLWAAYVFYGLFTQSGFIEPIVWRFNGGSSMKLDFVIAVAIGVPVYWLAGWPLRRLRALEGARPPSGRVGAPIGPARDASSPRPGSGRSLAWLAALALVGGGAWYLSSTPEKTSGSPPSTPAGSPSGGAAEASGALLNAVVVAQNDFGQVAAQSAAAYLREFGKGPQPRRGNTPRVVPLGASAEKSLQQLAQATSSGTGDEALQKLASAYVTAGRALVGPVGEAERYYGRGAQAEDGWTKGKALHGQLQVAFRDYFQAADALSVEARRLGIERRARSRARLEAAGSRRRVGAMDGVDQGRTVVELLERRLSHQAVDPAALAAALARFQATADALRGMAGDTAGTQRELGEVYAAASFGSFAQLAEGFLRDAKELDRQSLDPPAWWSERTESPAEQLIRSFNDMVREANHLSR